ncbi:DUF1330 domain-containing protein [Pseudoalteromonas sp. OF7H-1]|uniref:DUF1330 domain-containing protein n=1 Tax=Pseudoalteromonas sp. OF7H-1 TaxID=2917755 RepID=UPI001EF43706|nr:DUF1330 domain-containing protein [Pseudoalteromonas sp. OF7H-1]MCG7539486.1 DUF1330 domain-containing protein [Pseudoalteromonas sp. OF7H-1]
MYEMLVAMEIHNSERYAKYREAMKPILRQYGGGFSNDFHIAETLLTEGQCQANRLFTIYFPDQASMESFFSDAEYVEIKARYFEDSVSGFDILASYIR